MSNTPLTVKMVRLAGERERKLHARHGVSIRVDSIAHDERTLICTVFQHRRAPLSRPMDNIQLVQLSEQALAPLLGAGFNPMITAVDWGHAEDLRNSTDRPDAHDPLGLISALKDAGLSYPRLNVAAKNDDPVLALPFWRKALALFA